MTIRGFGKHLAALSSFKSAVDAHYLLQLSALLQAKRYEDQGDKWSSHTQRVYLSNGRLHKEIFWAFVIPYLGTQCYSLLSFLQGDVKCSTNPLQSV